MTQPRTVKLSEACDQCQGTGYYFRLPRGANPFRMSIETIAQNSRRIQCDCPAGRTALQQGESPHRNGGWGMNMADTAFCDLGKLEAALAQRDALVKALEPFAVECQLVKPNHPDGMTYAPVFTAKELRAARDVLKALRTTTSPTPLKAMGDE